MKKLASNLPLQDMIRSVINNATEKLAADEEQKEEKVKKLISYEKKEHGGKIPSVSEEEAEHEKKASCTDPSFVEKLASACDVIAGNVDNIEVAQIGVLQSALRKMAEEGSPQGPGKGQGALEVSKAIGGQQRYKKDKPATEDAAASQAGKPLHASHPGDGATQLENTMQHAPGGANYPEKGPLVNLKTASPRERFIAAIEKQASGEVAKTLIGRTADLIAKHPEAAKNIAAGTTGAVIGGAAAGPGHRIGGALGGGAAGVGALHGARALNKGISETAARHVTEGKHVSDIAKPVAEAATKTAAQVAREHILMKLAGEDVMKANISASRSASPLPGGSDLEVTDSTQKGPHQAGDPTGGFGNQARKHIASNSAAMGYTKGDAKGPQKQQLKEVLDEPALSRRTDSKLQENLRNTGSAGVKIAAARVALQKIASAGCQCNSSGECKYCQLKSAVRGSEKTANAMMGGGGMGAPGGGMGAMADAGAGADGCTCGNTGECRVCKLKAALAAAQAQGQGGAQPNTQDPTSSMGAGGMGAGQPQPTGGIY